MYNIFDNYQDRWTVDNQSQDVFYPRADYGPNANNSQKSTWWLRNMSFLRLKKFRIRILLSEEMVAGVCDFQCPCFRAWNEPANLLQVQSVGSEPGNR